MSRLIDFIKQNGILGYLDDSPSVKVDKSPSESLVSLLRDERHYAMQVIVADNVAAWTYAHVSGNQSSSLTEFPCIMPPFRDLWIEAVIPYGPNVKATPQGHIRADTLGMYAQSATAAEWLTVYNPARDRSQLALEVVAASKDIRAKWVVIIQPTMRFRDVVASLPVSVVRVDGDGGLIDIPVSFAPDNTDQDGDLVRHVHDALYFFFASMAFLNCKNVATAEVVPSHKLNKRRAKDGKLPLVTYKTLSVGAIGHTLRTEGKVGEVGLPKALGICRGHFKEFSPERPLFGKFAGRFYWPQHARGSKEAGEVHNTYVLTDAQRWAAETAKSGPQAPQGVSGAAPTG